ncbi:hypothetical protein MPTK1_3g13220 [Marchantia polymorpha subsp. ruderalis]|uniref:Uncharacterized protein n=2 Tax=Marchantia polymorpha TaxID=3197 RepID=A0AAF6B0C3_MARPO|nr:hypothetical protein MARPO_0050s0114 [Marchantia polymorpha]BBN05457.1 hypothetical protein Mp_3g13220 [Marchantia polymorpha subsp. ruderalis]|eukprot:PTQ38670.1 hypothetical protein MARPO_0050s0114 [Marchantia polymorpha]
MKSPRSAERLTFSPLMMARRTGSASFGRRSSQPLDRLHHLLTSDRNPPSGYAKNNNPVSPLRLALDLNLLDLNEVVVVVEYHVTHMYHIWRGLQPHNPIHHLPYHLLLLFHVKRTLLAGFVSGCSKLNNAFVSLPRRLLIHSASPYHQHQLWLPRHGYTGASRFWSQQHSQECRLTELNLRPYQKEPGGVEVSRFFSRYLKLVLFYIRWPFLGDGIRYNRRSDVLRNLGAMQNEHHRLEGGWISEWSQT